MVPIPSDCDSDHDRAEPMGTPLSLSPTTVISAATMADLDTLGATADLQFSGYAAYYWHAGVVREKQTGPTCHAAMSYIVLGEPAVLPTEILSVFPSHQRPSFLQVQELAGKG